LALAGAFRERGIISRRQVAQGALWQVLFIVRGARAEEVEVLAERGVMALRGVRPEQVAELVAEAMEPVLKPLLAPEVVDVAHGYRAQGHRVYIVSAALQEIVDALVADLGLDGGLGTVCEVADGRYTGRALRPLHGNAKAEALLELAASEGLDLAASTAYSDSHSDLPFLEAVGHPVAVSPDRALRKIAQERGWPILEARRRAG
jgi:HAD superfamily hydrolase (TIGR01490 family)